MSLKLVMDEVKQIKETLLEETGPGVTQWQPSFKSEFAPESDDSLGTSVAEPAPQGDAASTDPQP